MAASVNIFNKDDIILINDITYKIIKLIGHGKGGYSLLISITMYQRHYLPKHKTNISF